MRERKLTADVPTIHASSAGPGRTVESDRLPILGAGRRSQLAQLVFWRRLALTLIGYFVVRLMLDLASFAG